MKTPQVPALAGMTPLGFRKPKHVAKHFGSCLDPNCTGFLNPLATDQKTVAERAWQKGKLAPAPQKPCDVGLFSDDANQKELF